MITEILDDLDSKLSMCKSVKDFEVLINYGGKFTHEECIKIDNTIELSKFMTSEDFDRLYVMLSETHNYNS